MNLSHLYYFRKLVEVGSYSAAARELFVARPTLSLAISGLEKELGIPLLKKKRNGVELTKEGEEFYTAVLTATNVLNNCISEIKQKAEEEYGTIKIGVVYSVQSKAWSNLISEFRRITGVDIELRQGVTSSLLKDLKSGELDIVFSGLLGEGDSDLASIPCFTQRAALVVNKNHFLSQAKEVNLADLAPYNVLTYKSNEGPFAGELKRLFGDVIPGNVKCGFNDELSLCSMVVADPKCVAVVAYSWLVDSFPDLVTLRIREAPEDFHQFYMSYRKQGRKPLAVETFIDLTRDYAFDNDSPVIADAVRAEAKEIPVGLTGETLQTALIGSDVEKSLSPAIHTFSYDKLALNAVYAPFDVGSSQLESIVEGFKHWGVVGYNVGIPNKFEVAQYLDELSPVAELSGSVNCVKIENGKSKGFNTDGPGFISNLKRLGFDPSRKKVTLLGIDEVGLAIAMALALESVEQLDVFVRNDFVEEAALEHIQHLRLQEGIQIALHDLSDYEELRECISVSNLLVNSLHAGSSVLDKLAADALSIFPGDLLVADASHTKQKSKLLIRAKEMGLKTASGFESLVVQAALCEKIWFDVDMPIESVLERFTSV